jgi:hypothetical protein
MTMFCSKYALSIGIKKFDPGLGSNNTHAYDGPYSLLKIGSEAFNTLDEAIADAENRRVKKIASLRKQIKKLEAMTFP